MDPFELIPVELLQEQALGLDLSTISNWCQVSSRFNDAICNNEGFWRQKFVHDYRFIPAGHVDSWKRYYQLYLATWGMGTNLNGQLGLGDEVFGAKFPTILPNLKARHVACGESHTVVIDLEQQVWVFGYNRFGQLGLGDRENRSIPTLLPNIKAKQAACGDYYTMLIDTKDQVWVFGDNNSGQLGLGKDPNSPYAPPGRAVPTLLLGLLAKTIACGGGHSIVIDLEDQVWGFGRNTHGELGLGDQWYAYTPTRIGHMKAKAAACGWFHTLFIDLEDNVWGSGLNDHHQLASYQREYKSPARLGFTAKMVACGQLHSAVIDLEDKVWVFGSNEGNQLGLASSASNSRPVQVRLGRFELKAKQMSCSFSYSMFIDLEDQVWAIGYNFVQQSRDSKRLNRLPNFIAQSIACGKSHVMLIGSYTF